MKNITVSIIIFSAILFCNMSWSIEGGGVAGENEFLAVGGLVKFNSLQGNFAIGCTATLIHPQIIVTAAHCFTNEQPKFYAGKGQHAGVVHGQYKASWGEIYPEFFEFRATLRGDIAFYFLDLPVLGIEPIRPVIVEDLYDVSLGSFSLVGFGKDKIGYDERDLSHGIKRVLNGVMPVYSRSVSAIGHYIRGKEKNMRVVDSGGPLLLHRGDRYQLHGVMSHCTPSWKSCRSEPFTREVACWIEKTAGVQLTNQKLECKSYEETKATWKRYLEWKNLVNQSVQRFQKNYLNAYTGEFNQTNFTAKIKIYDESDPKDRTWFFSYSDSEQTSCKGSIIQEKKRIYDREHLYIGICNDAAVRFYLYIKDNHSSNKVTISLVKNNDIFKGCLLLDR